VNSSRPNPHQVWDLIRKLPSYLLNFRCRRVFLLPRRFGTTVACLLQRFGDVKLSSRDRVHGRGVGRKSLFFMWPLFAYFALVIFLAASVLVVSYLLGQRHSEPATGEPYEGGIVSEGSARARFSVRYYLIAAFFVVFDLEAVFLFTWAVDARELGWAGYCEVVLFVGILFGSLIYLWKVGALDWVKPRSPKASK
jgi:NADH-quinone oxidoreductase subunit A